jgi:hypothetical protein
VALSVSTIELQSRYAELKHAWLRGERNREKNLDLMFHAWMHWADPSFVTGLKEDPDALRIWHQVFEHFGGTRSSDVEFLFVAKVMVALFPWMLGDEGEWTQTAAALDRRLKNMPPSNLNEITFEGRGAYGKYFAHQLRGVPPDPWLERTRDR